MDMNIIYYIIIKYLVITHNFLKILFYIFKDEIKHEERFIFLNFSNTFWFQHYFKKKLKLFYSYI